MPEPDIYDPFGDGPSIRVTEVSSPRHPVLAVTFDDGVSREVDFSDILAKRGVWTTLLFKEAFRDVSVIHRGRAIQWINGVDFCADALRIKADEQYAARMAAAE